MTDGRIAPRSGLASKHSINTGAGVIDADYTGHVKVLLFNHADVDFKSQLLSFPFSVFPGLLLSSLVRFHPLSFHFVFPIATPRSS